MDRRPDALRDRGVEEIRADGGRWVKAEQQHEQGRHQRAAANACQADERADHETGKRIERIVRREDRCPLAHTIKGDEIAGFWLSGARRFAPTYDLGARGADLPMIQLGFYLEPPALRLGA